MLRLTITGRDGSSEVRQIGQVCTIGKDPSCDIVLKGFLIGKLHAKILNRGGRYYLEDEGGIASTLINGNPVTSYGPLTPSDKIEIGSYLLSVVQEQGQRCRGQPRARAVGRVGEDDGDAGAEHDAGHRQKRAEDVLAEVRPADEPKENHRRTSSTILPSRSAIVR